MSDPVPESYLEGLLPGATSGTQNYVSQEEVNDIDVGMIWGEFNNKNAIECLARCGETIRLLGSLRLVIARWPPLDPKVQGQCSSPEHVWRESWRGSPGEKVKATDQGLHPGKGTGRRQRNQFFTLTTPSCQHPEGLPCPNPNPKPGDLQSHWCDPHRLAFWAREEGGIIERNVSAGTSLQSFLM